MGEAWFSRSQSWRPAGTEERNKVQGDEPILVEGWRKPYRETSSGLVRCGERQYIMTANRALQSSQLPIQSESVECNRMGIGPCSHPDRPCDRYGVQDFSTFTPRTYPS